MRRRFLILASAAAALALAAGTAFAHGNEPGKAEATIGNAKVTITYGRPTLKGRDLSKMIQPGQVWRIGADMPTTIESDQDLDFGGTRVPKGKHVLLAQLKAPGQWSLIVSSQPVSHYQPAAKLAEVPMTVETAPNSVEALSITLASNGGSGTIEIAWGTSKLSASFKPAS
jgi:nucleoid-associated protein YgaU